jgi:carbonic anhydrase
MAKFDQFAFSADPAFDEAQTRKAFSKAVPLKTLVIYCYDPRAAEIPNAVAKLFGDEVFPGKVILDSSGSRVASSTTIFTIVVAGGTQTLTEVVRDGAEAAGADSRATVAS